MMDFFFPFLLIFLGLWVSTLELINQDFPMRALTSYQFPHGRPLIYNSENFNQTDEEIEDFIQMAFGADIGDGKLWSEARPTPVNTTSHFFDQVTEIDDIIYEDRLETGPHYGQFFVQQVLPDDRFYSIGVFTNSSSAASTLAYSAHACQAVMRSVLEKPNFRLNFHEKPLPFGFKVQTYVNAG